MAKKSSRKKPRFIRMRFRKGDPAHNLLAATQHWVMANGGSVAVIGGIEIQDWKESPHHFRIAVRCLGVAPPPKSPQEPAVKPEGHV
jgi:hypothetical protein